MMNQLAEGTAVMVSRLAVVQYLLVIAACAFEIKVEFKGWILKFSQGSLHTILPGYHEERRLLKHPEIVQT